MPPAPSDPAPAPTTGPRAIAASAQALATWSRANTAFVVTMLIGALLILVADWGAGEVYESTVEHDGLARFDLPLLSWVVAHRTPALDMLAATLARVGGTVGWTIVTVAVGLVLARRARSWTPVVLLTCATAGSVTMTVLGKRIAARVRPPHDLAIPPFESSPSFPSGHTLNTTVVVLVVAYLVILYRPTVRTGIVAVTGAILVAGLMGLSRVYLGAHWLTDVVAGWLLGVGWAAVVVLAHQVWLRRTQPIGFSNAARPASSRAIGTRNGEQDT